MRNMLTKDEDEMKDGMVPMNMLVGAPHAA
ncbi:hypothetical protein A2U01_0052792, partial [Trifolium medium]|nr:hypothetical protein [Trifolium medium]